MFGSPVRLNASAPAFAGSREQFGIANRRRFIWNFLGLTWCGAVLSPHETAMVAT
jgi:hypothetical protein